MKRHKHNLSNYKLATFDMGKLIPVGLHEAMPGDTFSMATSLLLRFQPLLAPVMHPISVRIHHFFVPFRLIWPDGWEDFITGGPDGEGSESPYPTNASELVVVKGDLYDYLGLPPATYDAGTVSTMPITAFKMIFNEYFRDQDLVSELTGENGVVPFISWEKDYFTTARPWTQKGPDVTIPLGLSAPVELSQDTDDPMLFRNAVTNAVRATVDVTTDAAGNLIGLADSIAGVIDPNGRLVADLAAATSPSMIAFRRAFALQRYQEARAQYGSRYTEFLRYYGIKPSDARLQRPEYLGGGKQTVSISEVLDTSGLAIAAGQSPAVGRMRGHGIAALRSNRFKYFCEEHGYVVTLLSVRPKAMYVQGVDRTWQKFTKELYYQKELELIGQQEIYKKELFWNNTPEDDEVFGYQDRYSEYRHQRSTVAGDFRDTLLHHWHMARIFTEHPVLNSSFINADPTTRVFATLTTDAMMAMVQHNVKVRRILGKKTIGKLI